MDCECEWRKNKFVEKLCFQNNARLLNNAIIIKHVQNLSLELTKAFDYIEEEKTVHAVGLWVSTGGQIYS